MTDPLFQVGDKVKARREPRLLMTVADVGLGKTTSKTTVPLMYCCVVDDEHSAAHGRGRSTRWFREEDLDVR